MKIGFYVPTWPPGSDANGIVTYAANAIPALRKIGHDVVVITPNLMAPDANAIDLKIFEDRPHRWKRGLSKLRNRLPYYSLVSAIKHLVATKRIEALEIEETSGWNFEVSKLGILPVIVRLHGPWFLTKSFEDRAREAKELRAIREATFVTSPSQSVLDSVRARCPEIAGRSAVVYNSMDPPAGQWRLENCDQNSLLYVGRFDELKGGDLVLRAFNKLANDNEKLKLTFVGRDVGIDGLKAVDYARTFMSNSVFSRLTFLGEKAPADIERLRSKHFLTISSSRYEVFGYTVLESLAFGCPTIAPAVGGIPELIDSGQNGLLFKADDHQDLALACRKMVGEPDMAAALGREARLRSSIYFSTGRNAVHASEFYRQALEAFRDRNYPFRQTVASRH